MADRGDAVTLLLDHILDPFNQLLIRWAAQVVGNDDAHLPRTHDRGTEHSYIADTRNLHNLELIVSLIAAVGLGPDIQVKPLPQAVIGLIVPCRDDGVADQLRVPKVTADIVHRQQRFARPVADGAVLVTQCLILACPDFFRQGKSDLIDGKPGADGHVVGVVVGVKGVDLPQRLGGKLAVDAKVVCDPVQPVPCCGVGKELQAHQKAQHIVLPRQKVGRRRKGVVHDRADALVHIVRDQRQH